MNYDYSDWTSSKLSPSNSFFTIHKIFYAIIWKDKIKIFCQNNDQVDKSEINFCDIITSDVIAMKDLFYYSKDGLSEFNRNYCQMVKENNRN